MNQKIFIELPQCVIAYWIGEKLASSFLNKSVNDYCKLMAGIKTGDNETFVRLWNEVDVQNINLYPKCTTDLNQYKWYKYNKGGGFRKWYGNNINVINMKNGGEDIKNKISKDVYRLRDQNYYFKECCSWSLIGIDKFSIRFSPKGSLFDTAGSSLFSYNNMYFLGLLSSKCTNEILKAINPTIKYSLDSVSNIPCIIKNESAVEKIARSCIGISKNDWDSFETSWDFKLHPLLNMKNKYSLNKISDSFDELDKEWNENFYKLKANEEELNRIFIDIYGLQDELTPEEEDKDVTIRKADRERDIKSFISYAVGCMFGRYSLDAEGLIYAGGDFSDKWNAADKKVRNTVKDEDGNVVSDTWVDVSYIPDTDNIIPVTDDEYFEDDIVSRFIEFVKTVYGDETLDENLDYIADSIGRKSSETAKQCIRRYFLKDFYKDHLKIYQKRPIYWMFDSGKNDGFKCLIYMHRYNEQTVAKVRTDYLHMLQRKYEAQINVQQLTLDSVNSSTKDKTLAKKKIDKITKQIHECMEYDQVVSYIANESIAIDLDDGVKVNYAKFQGVGIINSKGKEEKMNLLAKI